MQMTEQVAIVLTSWQHTFKARIVCTGSCLTGTIARLPVLYYQGSRMIERVLAIDVNINITDLDSLSLNALFFM